MIMNEEQLLDPAVRKKIIESFDDEANKRRKAISYKGYECLKDRTVNYVVDLLLCQFDRETVYEMQYALTNVSVLRKVIDKLAKVYSNGVKRSMGAEDEKGTDELEEAAKYLDMNGAMKKANRYFRTFKNTLVYVKPVVAESDREKRDVRLEVLPPHLYDVMPDPADPTRALAVVLSDYVPNRPTLYTLGDAARAGRGSSDRVVNENGDKLVQSYTPPSTGHTSVGGSSEDKRTFVWWSGQYHFTTNARGEKIDNGDTVNPILALPFVNVCGEQDGEFYARGGEDLIDAGVQINVGLTNVKHVGVQQGYGQLYMTGKNLPRKVKVGPTQCLQIEVADGEDPTPQVGYLNAAPQLKELQSTVEMEVALMLSTNNLSTSGFATSLSSTKDFASGVALMIDKSESVEDVNDQAEVFIKKEPKVWGLAQKWQGVLTSAGLATEELSQAPIPPTVEEEMVLRFPPAKPIMTEQEHLDVLAKRKELGLSSRVEMLMRDDPSLTEAKAREKLEALHKEEMEALDPAMGMEEGEPQIDPATGKPLADATAGSTDIQKEAMNGAQVSGLIDVVARVSSKEIPVASAQAIIELAFQLSPQEAARIVAPAGSFEAAKPKPAAFPGRAPGAAPEPEDMNGTEGEEDDGDAESDDGGV